MDAVIIDQPRGMIVHKQLRQTRVGKAIAIAVIAVAGGCYEATLGAAYVPIMWGGVTVDSGPPVGVQSIDADFLNDGVQMDARVRFFPRGNPGFYVSAFGFDAQSHMTMVEMVSVGYRHMSESVLRTTLEVEAAVANARVNSVGEDVTGNPIYSALCTGRYMLRSGASEVVFGLTTGNAFRLRSQAAYRYWAGKRWHVQLRYDRWDVQDQDAPGDNGTVSYLGLGIGYVWHPAD